VGINVEWRSEFQESLGSVLDPRGFLGRALQSADLSRALCARFIDPYGDAIFNQSQLPTLSTELTALRDSTEQLEVRSHLDHILRLVEGAHRHVHTYVWFIGD
jgi:hypothetical protein